MNKVTWWSIKDQEKSLSDPESYHQIYELKVNKMKTQRG